MLKKLWIAGIAVLSLIGLAAVIGGAFVWRELRQDTGPVPIAKHDAPKSIPAQATAEERYLELLKRVLTRYDLENGYRQMREPKNPLHKWGYAKLNEVITPRGKRVVDYKPVALADSEEGRGWPEHA